MIFDTGVVVGTLNAHDPDHGRCEALILTTETRLIPSPTLVEINYLTTRRTLDGWLAFVGDIAAGAYRVVHPTTADILRAAELEERYADLRLGFVDAATIAICERLRETEVATLDHRHFSAVRPAHCEALTLLPE